MTYEQLFRLDGKVALVTGASKGIGQAIARGLAEFGAQVVVNSRKPDAVEATAAAMRADGLTATALAGNVGNLDEARTLVDQTVAAYGRLDILVNNAAVNPVFGPIQGTDERAFDKIMAVNLKGPFELAKQAYSVMQKQGGGSIINVSSIGGLTPEPMLGIYSVSKAGLISLTKAMAQDWGRDGIRVNAICPGLIQTKFSAALWQTDAVRDHFVQQTPLQRIGQPQDIVGLAVFLASEAAAYCTGAVFLVDGGYLA